MSADNGMSPGRLIGEIVGNVQDIFRAEVRLVAVELRDEANRIQRLAVLWIAAAVVGVLGLGWLLFAAIQLLALVMALWSAALIVSLATLGAAGLLIVIARRRARQIGSPLPRTRASIAEIAQWKQTPEH